MWDGEARESYDDDSVGYIFSKISNFTKLKRIVSWLFLAIRFCSTCIIDFREAVHIERYYNSPENYIV